jgi:hypothetical protein
MVVVDDKDEDDGGGCYLRMDPWLSLHEVLVLAFSILFLVICRGEVNAGEEVGE